MIPVYPHTLPQIRVAEYEFIPDMGLVRSVIATLSPRQRRGYKQEPTVIGGSFAVAVNDMFTWQKWMQHNGFTWFQIDVVSQLTPADTHKCSVHVLRLISNIVCAPISNKVLNVECSFELYPKGL